MGLSVDTSVLDAKIKEATKVFKKRPQSLVFAVLADWLRQRKSYKEAIQVCQHGLNYHPQFAKAYTVLGQIYHEQRDYHQAILPLQTACDLEPDNILGLKLLGESYLRLGHPKKSLKVYEQLLLYYPESKWVQQWVEKLNQIEVDKYSHFSTESVEEVSTYLRKKEFERLPVLKPYNSHLSHKRKRDHSQVIASVKASQKEEAQTTQTAKQEEQIKKLQELLNKLSPSDPRPSP